METIVVHKWNRTKKLNHLKNTFLLSNLYFKYEHVFLHKVIQRRYDGSVDFNRSLSEYEHGFGCVSGEFWFGLYFMKYISMLGLNKLHVYLEDWDGEFANVQYERVSVGTREDGYLANIGKYVGVQGNYRGHYVKKRDGYIFGLK